MRVKQRKNKNPLFQTTEQSESRPKTNAERIAELAPEKAEEISERIGERIPQPSQDISGSRVSFSVKPDGSPDWERMQEKSRIQLREILRNPEVLDSLGISASTAPTKSDTPSIGRDECGMLLDFFGMMTGAIAGRLYKVPPEVTREAFQYDDFHRKKLTPPMERILNKWSPFVLKTYKDEVGFLMLFCGTLNVQVKTMHYLEAKRRAALPAISPDRVTSINERKTPEPKTEPQAPGKTDSDVLDQVGIVGFDL